MTVVVGGGGRERGRDDAAGADDAGESIGEGGGGRGTPVCVGGEDVDVDEGAGGLDDGLEGAIGSQCRGRDVVWRAVRGRGGLEGVVDGGEVPVREEFED